MCRPTRRILLSAAVLFAGCGNSGTDEPRRSGAAASDPVVGDGPTLVATLGDSITAGTPRWDPDPAVRATIAGPDPRHQWQYWAARANPELRFRNCGVNRQRTDEIARRLPDCVGGATVLVVQGGINDLAQGRGAAHAERNLRDMVVAGRRAGTTVLLAEVLPWNAGHPTYASQISDLNRRIRALAVDEGVDVLPFYATLEDAGAAGRMRAEWTIDGSHPSVEGHRRLGEIAFTRPSAEGP